MRILISRHALSAAVGIAFLAGCSGASTVAPRQASPDAVAPILIDRVRSEIYPFGSLDINTYAARQIESFNMCPASGQVEYVSDAYEIFIYAGKFAGQAPCGELSSKRLKPFGLFVDTATHDLYVANDDFPNVLVFHKSQGKPYNSYTDPNNPITVDVTVSRDGTIIASDLLDPASGAISTWLGGPNGGTFVGSYPMANHVLEGSYITVQKDGTVYFDDAQRDDGPQYGALWTVSCPAGICGPQTQIAGVRFSYALGIASDSADDVLVADAQFSLITPSTVKTFHLPNPKPSSFSVIGSPNGIAINARNDFVFVAGGNNGTAAEYTNRTRRPWSLLDRDSDRSELDHNIFDVAKPD